MAKYINIPFATSGNKTAIPDTTTDGTVNYTDGFGADYARPLGTDPLAKTVDRETINQALYDYGTAIEQLQENGFFTWQSTKAGGYDIGAVVSYSGVNYVNTVAANTAAPDVSGWAVFMSITIDTIADMEALIPAGATASAYDKLVCVVRDLDRGGTFIYDSTKVADDNQGTNFNGWVRQYSGAVNVKWFGAKDGMDISQEVSKALMVSDSINIQLKNVVMSTVLINNMEDKLITSTTGCNINFNSNNDELFAIRSSSNINIENLKFNVGNTYISGRCISMFIGTINCTVTNCTFNKVAYGIFLGYPDGTNQDLSVPTSNCIIENNKFISCNQALLTRAKNLLYDDSAIARSAHIIKGNVFETDNDLNGLNIVDCEYWGVGGKIINNTFNSSRVTTNKRSTAISLARCNDIVVENNSINGLYGYQGIELATVLNSRITTNYIQGVINTDNNCAGIGVSNAVTGLYSINNNINSNTIVNCKVGLQVGIAKSTLLSNNSIKGSLEKDINIVGGATSVAIIGNSFRDNLGTYSIYFIGGNSVCQISSNLFTNINMSAIYSENGAGQGRELFIDSNIFNGFGNGIAPYAIFLRNRTTTISNNTFMDDGRDKTNITRNTVNGFARSFGYGLMLHILNNNRVIGTGITLDKVGINDDVAPVHSDNADGWYNNYALKSYDVRVGNKVLCNLIQSPKDGNAYIAGDIAYTVYPTASGTIGWVCTTSGNNVSPASWAASTVYSIDNIVHPTTANGRYYKCTTAGTSASSEPTWTTTTGDTITDGTVVWTDMGTIAVWKTFGTIGA